MMNKRIESLDLLRGLALMLIIIFHSSIYNFANIHRLDFSNPPVVVVLMSFMALWGGIFIIYSMVVNTMMILRRHREGTVIRLFVYPLIAGLIYIFFHYILNIFTGRWNIDFVNNKPDMTVIAGSLRNLHFTFPPAKKFFEGSSLSTVAFNLIILSGILSLLLRKNGIAKETRNYLLLGISGFLIMMLSFIRVPLFHYFSDAVANGHYLAATILSFAIANPYPLLPYLAYGLMGTMIGMMVYNEKERLLKTIVLPLGLFFLAYGFYGMTQFDKSISKPDYFWYFKTQFELGVFIIMIIAVLLVFESIPFFIRKLSFIKWFSRVTLTVYMVETLTSELMRMLWFRVIPAWDQTINGCLAFGLVNILLWITILYFWQKSGFRYSLEYFWTRYFSFIGRNSTKMDLR